MRWLSVRVVPPIRQHLAGVRQAPEHRLVQQIVAQATVEAFDEAALHRFARCNVVPGDARFLLPAQQTWAECKAKQDRYCDNRRVTICD